MKIVLTGGPSAGKTSVVEVLARSAAAPGLVIVEEAAALLFRGGFPRCQRPEELRCQQVAIYHVQKQLEMIASLDATGRSLICDRGSLDGLAYWPGDEASFFAAIGSTMQNELARYDWVIHLETANPPDYRKTNMRVEDAQTAASINERVKQAWALHPNRIIIPADHDFLEKIRRSVDALSLILARKESPHWSFRASSDIH